MYFGFSTSILNGGKVLNLQQLPLAWDGGKSDGSPGANHINKITKESIPTPHVNGKNKIIPGGVRTPLPWEIPQNQRFNPTQTGS